MDTFGENLKELRKEKGIVQIQLANEIEEGKSLINLLKLNRCEPTLSNLISY